MDVSIDFGTEQITPEYKDETGNILCFAGYTDALNFMSSKGWEFVQAYTTVELSGSTTSMHIILRQKFKKAQ